MNIPYEVIGYVDWGGNGVVFMARYNTQKVALKIYYGKKEKQDLLAMKCKKEFEYLSRLRSVNGVPNPILLLDGLKGNYEELGLASSGKSLEDSLLSMTFPEHYIELYFSGAFLFDLVKGSGKVSTTNKQPKRFFDKLEAIVREVHEQGLSIPHDIDILEANGNPYLVDWELAIDFNVSPDKKESLMDENMHWINRSRYAYQCSDLYYHLIILPKKLLRKLLTLNPL